MATLDPFAPSISLDEVVMKVRDQLFHHYGSNAAGVQALNDALQSAGAQDDGLNHQNFEDALQKCGVFLALQDLHALERRFELKGSGTQELVAAVRMPQAPAATPAATTEYKFEDVARTLSEKIMEHSSDAQQPGDVLAATFKFYNEDDSGKVTKPEFEKVMQHYGMWLDERAYSELFSRFASGDRMQYDGFVEAVVKVDKSLPMEPVNVDTSSPYPFAA